MGNKKSGIRLVGLEYLQFADVRSTGVFPTTAASFSTIGNVVPDSAHLVIEAPESTELFVEEEDTPDIVIFGNSKKFIEFAVRDMGTNMLVYAFGANGSATATVYRFPTTTQIYREQAVFAQSKTINGKKLKIQIPRASILGGGDLKFARTDSGTLTFTCQILLPETSTQISPCVITQV